MSLTLKLQKNEHGWAKAVTGTRCGPSTVVPGPGYCFIFRGQPNKRSLWIEPTTADWSSSWAVFTSDYTPTYPTARGRQRPAELLTHILASLGIFRSAR